jgi:hypothetical protein
VFLSVDSSVECKKKRKNKTNKNKKCNYTEVSTILRQVEMRFINALVNRGVILCLVITFYSTLTVFGSACTFPDEYHGFLFKKLQGFSERWTGSLG